MILDEGMFGGEQVLSSNWIREMTTPYIKLDDRFGNMNYGYLWYKPYDDRQVFAAIGDGGNVIYVNKEKNLSVGVTGTFKPRIFDRVEFIEKIMVVTE